MKIISRDDDSKCSGCNWRTGTKYGFENQDLDKEGLCAECFAKSLVGKNVVD